MDLDTQLLPEASSQPPGCYGIEAPSLLQQAILAEESMAFKEIKPNETSAATDLKQTSPSGQIELKTRMEKGGDRGTRQLDQESKDKSKVEQVFDGQQADSTEDVQSESDSDKPQRDKISEEPPDRKAKGDGTEIDKASKGDSVDLLKSAQSDSEGKKGDGNDKQRRSTLNGTCAAEITPDDRNNNVNISEKTKKNSVKRTRFSSEITIQPKAYFQVGVDSVITLPLGSPTDDVFQDDLNRKSDPSSTTSHITLDVKPSELTIVPRTFLSLTLFSCFFCCPMIGLFAVYRSYLVKQYIKKGDMKMAHEASQQARQLGFFTMLVGCFFILAIIAIAVLVGKLS